MPFHDKRCALLLETINSYHSSVEFSQSVSNEYSSVEFSQSVNNEYSSLAKAHAVRDYPKGCGRQILTKEKDFNDNEEPNSNVAKTKINGTKDEEGNKFLIERKLEQSRAFPSILKDSHAIKQRNECQPNAAAFHKEAASKVNSSDNVVAFTLQKNNDTIEEVVNIKPELQIIKKEVEELTSKKKRKTKNQYEIVVIKKSKNDFLVGNNNNADVSINFKSYEEKVSHDLQLFRAIYNRIHNYNLAYNEFVGKYGKSNQRIIGKVPGVEIGDEFYFRAEMYIIGLHCQLVAGIDYVKQHGKKIAISIVSSNRQYSNKKCDNDVLMYLGTGVTFDKDQKFEGGNLALKNSIEDKIQIRVIHGRTRSGKKTYVYDGLYLAEKYTIEDCKLMFQLRRIPGQAEIDIRGLEILPNVPLYDISNGKEDKPIKVVNDIDDERFPHPFIYITNSIYPSSYTITKPICCDCVDGCSDLVKCACVVKNGGSLPFNSDGALVECKPLVYECGLDCKCPPSCDNRVSQLGIKFPLEVFKTKLRGWGVRSSSFIPSGSFICEYVGEILEEEDAEKRTNDEYLFAIGSNYHDKSRWDDDICNIPSLQKDACREVDVPVYSIDALRYGNVARFINHSCTPNIVAQELLYDNDDIRVPRIMLFAGEDIQPNQELTYDYNYSIDQVHDTNGDLKKKECHCGSFECNGWLY